MELKTFGGVEVKVRNGMVGKGNKKRILTREDELLAQKIAVCLNLKQPILIEGESGLGKTEMIDFISEECQWPLSYLNCHDMEPDQIMGSKTLDNSTKSGFGYKAGALPIGIEEGHLTILDEYNFIRGETRAVLTEPLDALLRKKTQVKNTFNDGRMIPVHKNFRLIALQNPPGGVYGNREVLDPPQLSRFVHLRLDNMTKEQKISRTHGEFGIKIPTFRKQDKIITTGTWDQFDDISQVKLYIKKYVEFSVEFDELVKIREIGSTYEQPIYTSFQREFDRVKQFMFQYPQENLAKTFVKAVSFYYFNKITTTQDKTLLKALISKHFEGGESGTQSEECESENDSKEDV